MKYLGNSLMFILKEAISAGKYCGKHLRIGIKREWAAR